MGRMGRGGLAICLGEGDLGEEGGRGGELDSVGELGRLLIVRSELHLSSKNLGRGEIGRDVCV